MNNIRERNASRPSPHSEHQIRPSIEPLEGKGSSIKISEAQRHITDAQNSLASVLEHTGIAPTAMGTLSAPDTAAHQPPLRVLFSHLDSAMQAIDRASTTLGDPKEDIPIFRLPNPNNTRPPLNHASPLRPILSEGALLPDAPQITTHTRSFEGLIHMAQMHLGLAQDSLGSHSDIPLTPPSPNQLKQTNSHLKQAKNYITAAKSNLQVSHPTQDPRPPRPPIIGGDEDLFPRFKLPDFRPD